jgi:hypothetical protein
MKRIKRFTCAFAVLAITMMVQPNPALAKYSGTLRSDTPWAMDFTPEVTNSDNFVVTVTFVDSKGRSDTDFYKSEHREQTLVVSQSQIPRDTRLIIIEVDLPSNGRVQMRITQGATVVTHDVCETGCSSRFVFAVI